MRVKTIVLGDTTVSLRLTASKLQQYIKDYSNESQSPLLAVLDAVEPLKNKAALFTAALQYKGNTNTVKDGYELLDLMTDAGFTPMQVKHLIVDLAEDSGLVDPEDTSTVRDAIDSGNRKFINVVAKVLSGDAPEPDAPTANPEDVAEENPT